MYNFLEGCASSIRLFNFNKIFPQSQYETAFIGYGYQKYRKKTIIKDYQVYSVRRTTRVGFIFSVFNHLFDIYKDATNLLLSQFKSPSIIVLPIHFPKKLIAKIRTHYEKLNVFPKFLFSAMEESSMKSFYKYELSNKPISNDFKETYAKNAFGIAISSNLSDRLNRLGLKTIRVPFIFDKNYFQNNEKISKQHTSFLYTGNPGKKDSLFMMLEAFALLTNKEKEKICLHVFGVTAKWLFKQRRGKQIYSKIKPFTIFHGRTPPSQVRDIYYQIDFSILLRDPRSPVSQAGFPTKVAESLFNSTPVVCNITSDLGLYLNENNSIIVKSFDVLSFKDALSRSLTIEHNERQIMSKNARLMAETNLEIDCFKKKVLNFIGE